MGVRAHWLQHVPFEGLGCIEGWLARKRAKVSATRFFESSALPGQKDFDLLIVMGGPMSVNEEDAYPWLREEKDFVRAAVDGGKMVLGVCLGAQLIASSLGAGVRRNSVAEIGWFPVVKASGKAADATAANANAASPIAAGPIAAILPDRLDAFHWHGETFELPPGALHIARSEACENQAFTFGDRVAAFQFHLETTPAAARALLENCRGDLLPGRFVQSESEILGRPDQFRRINGAMEAVLDLLTGS